jgi:hypothetical protein
MYVSSGTGKVIALDRLSMKGNTMQNHFPHRSLNTKCTNCNTQKTAFCKSNNSKELSKCKSVSSNILKVLTLLTEEFPEN